MFLTFKYYRNSDFAIDSLKGWGRGFTLAEATFQFIEKMSKNRSGEVNSTESGSLSQNHQKAEQRLSEEGF